MKHFIHLNHAMLFVAMISAPVFAHDVLPPCWRGNDGSTFQVWSFNSTANPAAPELQTNSYGTASATMVVGAPGLGWQTNVAGYGTQSNFWGLGNGSMTIAIPNRPGSPSASWKLVSLQVAQFVDGSIFTDASASLPGATLLDVANVSVESVPPSGGWQVRRFLWRLEPNPASETITITKGSGLDLFIDQIVVDTLCITNANTYVDDNYVGATNCTLVAWPNGVGLADKSLGLLAFADPQSGVDRAPTNGVVNVADGNYGSVLTVNKPVTVSLGPTPAAALLGSLTLGSSATLAMDINGLTPGTQHDQWVVFSGVSLGGATLALTCNTNLTVGSQITLIEQFFAGTVSGAFAGWPQGGTNTIGGQQFKVAYGNDVVLTMVNHVPIPGVKIASTTQNIAASIYTQKLVGAATDPDVGDTITFVGPVSLSASNGTVVTSILDGVPAITYTPPPNFVGTDYVYYTITDGKAVSTGTVTVTVNPGTGITFNMLPLVISNTYPFVQFAGVRGHTYELQRSPDLSNWVTITTILLPTNGIGIGSFHDTGAPPTNAFYRTHLP